MLYLGIFGQKCFIWVFLTRNALFNYFWARILKMLLSYLKSAHIWNQHSQIWPTAKFCEKIKTPNFGTKNALFGYFWARILKNYCHNRNQHPQICRNWVFNSYSKFWCRVRFFYRCGFGFGSALQSMPIISMGLSCMQIYAVAYLEPSRRW